MLMLAYITYIRIRAQKQHIVVIFIKRKLNLSRENSQHSRSQPAKVLLYHNQLHGFVFLPLWPQVNISFSIETAWTTVAHMDKFHFLLTFADVIQWRQKMYGIRKSVKLLKLQIFIPLLITIFKRSWKLKKSLQYLKSELRYNDILNLDKFVAQKRSAPL